MTTFKTMSEYDVIHAAHSTILDKWYRETQHKDRLVKEGFDTTIADGHLARYEAQLKELETVLIKMEHEKA